MQNHVLARLLMLAAAVASLGARHAAPRQSPPRQLPALTPHDSALHALDRLAYGPRPGEVDAVAAGGVMNWIDGQLSPDQLDDRLVAERATAFRILRYDPRDLARLYAAARNERREGRQGGKDEEMGRRLAGEVEQLAVVRAALSRRQLYEVMVDFWANHFNVFFGKGADRVLAPSYIEETLRPRAFGKFADLLIATARSPAMLFYLDNWESVAPGSAPPAVTRPRLGARPWFGRGRYVPGFSREPAQADSQRQRVLERMPKGINENYARELLELHTLGVDGGYTQQDVIEVARIFTGWSIKRPQQGGGFEFHDWAHDDGEKTVLGVRFPAGHGTDEGVRLLKLLASLPATMHHVSRKLCQRLVNDDPPDGCVDDAVAAWKHSSGDMREVVRAIVHGPDFWAPQNIRAKVKTPLEFVVSAVRAVGGDPDTTPRLAQVVARLGQPLYRHVAPDGYPEREEAWVNSGALLDRMNVAVALAAGRLPGVTVALEAVAPATADAEQLIAAVNDGVLGGAMSDNTRRVIRDELAAAPDPVAARALAVGLTLGGPEFQRQ
ncbi:MAG: DUF1800 domain-containing protein [Gemmatimonadetes bacterium]|nr:MAG: DUF1800 domain-containing protein [Gemmatimonadota bacterium]